MASAEDFQGDRLIINVISAENIYPRDLNGYSDTFVVLQMNGEKKKTRVIKKDLNPVYNERFEFPVNDKDHDVLVLEVWDKDTISRADFEGRVEVPLKNLPSASKLERDFDLQPRPDKADDGRVTGSIRLGLTFLNESDVLYEAIAAADMERLESVLQATPDVNVPFSFGATPLFCAAQHGHTAVVEKLLSVGAGINEADVYGETAIMAAALEAREEVCNLLVEKGASLTETAGNEMTVLHCAAKGGLASLVDKCIEAGLDINAKDCNGLTPLHCAAGWGEQGDAAACVTALLAAGAEVNAKTNDGDTPLEFAEDDRVIAIVKEAGGVEEEDD